MLAATRDDHSHCGDQRKTASGRENHAPILPERVRRAESDQQLRSERQTLPIGTAKLRFSPPPETRMPTTRPCLSTAGPPEFPGFAAASVWIAFDVTRLTTPVVTVPSSP